MTDSRDKGQRKISTQELFGDILGEVESAWERNGRAAFSSSRPEFAPSEPSSETQELDTALLSEHARDGLEPQPEAPREESVEEVPRFAAEPVHELPSNGSQRLDESSPPSEEAVESPAPATAELFPSVDPQPVEEPAAPVAGESVQEPVTESSELDAVAAPEAVQSVAEEAVETLAGEARMDPEPPGPSSEPPVPSPLSPQPQAISEQPSLSELVATPPPADEAPMPIVPPIAPREPQVVAQDVGTGSQGYSYLHWLDDHSSGTDWKRLTAMAAVVAVIGGAIWWFVLRPADDASTQMVEPPVETETAVDPNPSFIAGLEQEVEAAAASPQAATVSDEITAIVEPAGDQPTTAGAAVGETATGPIESAEPAPAAPAQPVVVNTGPTTEELEAMITRQLAAQERRLRAQLDEQRRQMEEEIARLEQANAALAAATDVGDTAAGTIDDAEPADDTVVGADAAESEPSPAEQGEAPADEATTEPDGATEPAEDGE